MRSTSTYGGNPGHKYKFITDVVQWINTVINRYRQINMRGMFALSIIYRGTMLVYNVEDAFQKLSTQSNSKWPPIATIYFHIADIW